MPQDLSSSFVIEIFLLLGLLFLPLPTSPYILYLFTSNTIIEAGIIFFIATTSRDFISFYAGSFSRNVNLKVFYSKIPNFLLKKESGLILKVQKATDIAKEKLLQASTRDVIFARWLGLHPILIAFGSGRIALGTKIFFIPNTFFVLLDVFIYWVLLGTGKIAINYFFPNFSLKSLMEMEYIYLFSVILIIIFYLVYGIHKWRMISK